MSAASILDSMVSVTSLNHGGASKALSQVGDNHPVVVLKNNQPSAVIITPADYRRLTQADVFGEDYEPIDDGFEPEFE